ncbi:nucleotidyltransferase [Elioraea sp. Yellowstone]|uniref:nucleotidyltransferase domain-containing protein n=1 Tax=Elioraea sp. Yellowstone TaxID=2592070 RepID=UPI00114EF959|nr:nucleotidyltransferase domain-containing protein [Elioraea sp. Yellowstone]TQF77474.1 nucleotidyltransferase [Elioraea sp. Yellowstone]
MTADAYLLKILAREAVDTGPAAPVRGVQARLMPALQEWAGQHLRFVRPSGSFAKGTANKSGTDIDLFISISENVPQTMRDIYNSLADWMAQKGYKPRKQNVSINVSVNGYSVDLVPAKRQDSYSEDHSLYRRKADTWTKTNVATHINHVIRSGRAQEIRVLKLWRHQKGLDFPSFYLELTTISALCGANSGLADRVWKALRYIRDTFPNARVMDPANTNNVISDDLTAAEKAKVVAAARQALAATDWNQIVR